METSFSSMTSAYFRRKRIWNLVRGNGYTTRILEQSLIGQFYLSKKNAFKISRVWEIGQSEIGTNINRNKN